MLLYRCLMGSRLYGTSRPDSDWDWMEVYTAGRIRQKINADQDVTRISFSTFMRYASTGSHQILEAMFAPPAEIDLFYDLRTQYYCDTIIAALLYKRTILSFLKVPPRREVKAIRAAMRMVLNLEQILTTARFNPVLSDRQIEMTIGATKDSVRARLQYLGDKYSL